MKKTILLLLLMVSINGVKSQDPAKISNRSGTFYVKYLGTGNWDYAKSKASEIGYRLPTTKELKEILMNTPGNSSLWTSLRSQGFIKGTSGGPWIWTSKSTDDSWSDYANKNMAIAIRFGSSNNSIYEQQVYDGEEFMSERSSRYGNIFAVKKVK